MQPPSSHAKPPLQTGHTPCEGEVSPVNRGNLPRPADAPRPSPNLWQHPLTYELENRAFDPGGLVFEAMASVADWAGRDVLDIGCGTGFHLPLFARTAHSVVGIEPHPPLRAIAGRRNRRLPAVEVRAGSAAALPVEDDSVDVAHARWAYFFGPGCEPGLTELDRVLRPGGTAFVLDNDPTRSTFGGWFRRGFPEVDPRRVHDFWAERGWRRIPILTEWRFEDRAGLEDVVGIELPPTVAAEVLAGHTGFRVDYAVNLWWRRSPG